MSLTAQQHSRRLKIKDCRRAESAYHRNSLASGLQHKAMRGGLIPAQDNEVAIKYMHTIVGLQLDG